MLFILDNYDSFTYNLVDYFAQLGEQCVVYRNDEISVAQIEELKPQAIVLSPGPNAPQDSGILMEMVEFFHKKKPLLGVCLGHQAIGEYFGASLELAAQPMHGMTSMTAHSGDELFKQVSSPFEVMRYHSLVLKNIENSPLIPLANTVDGELMAFRHKILPIYGVQFHPESILTLYGIDILRNWLRIINE